MKEFKFRAWDNRNKKMWYSGGFNITHFFDSEGVFPDEVIDITYRHYDWIWQQYTGLKDKNGHRIYEGDIIKRFGLNEPFNQVVELEHWTDDDWGDDCCGYMIPKGSEIIGNIYENKDLLIKCQNYEE